MNKLYKYIIAILVIASLQIPALAYNETPFTDIDSSQWYYEYVKYMYDNQIIRGFEDSTFRPNFSLSYAQIVTLLSRIKQLDLSGYDNSNWYSAAAEWFRNNLGLGVDDYSQPISRRDMFKYIVKLYDLKPNDYENYMIQNGIKVFADENTAETYIMYDLGILTGMNDENGNKSFMGDDSLNYAQASAILYRIINSDMDNTNLKIDYHNLLDHSYYENLKNVKYDAYSGNGILETFGYALYSGTEQLTFTLKSDSNEFENEEFLRSKVKMLSNLAEIALEKYDEFGGFIGNTSVEASYTPEKAIITYTFVPRESNLDGYNTVEQREYFKVYCEEAVVHMYETGDLKLGMSTYDKAKAIFQFVDINLEYDSNLSNETGYKAWRDKKATCMGYTAIYDYMCKLAGITTEGISGNAVASDGRTEAHAWTRINDNGSYYYCDVTWGDPVPNREGYSDLSWFWLTENEISKDHFKFEVSTKY